MKQNRNRVRLTESQFKQMIAESVKKALNEIDWRGLSQDEWDYFRREVNDIHDSDYDDDDDYEFDDDFNNYYNSTMRSSFEETLNNGEYDKWLFDNEWVESLKEFEWYTDSIYKAIESRRNKLKAQNESRLRKIVSESIDRVLKNK